MNTTSSNTAEATVSSVVSRKVPLTAGELRTFIEDDPHNMLKGVIIIAKSASGTKYRIESTGSSRKHLLNSNDVRVRPAACTYTREDEQKRVNENMLVALTNQMVPAFQFDRSPVADEGENLELTVMNSDRKHSIIDTSGQLVEIGAVIDWTKVGT